MKRITRLAFVLTLVLSSRGLAAVDKIDLDRVVPVPADQPIPTQDFFRPRLLSQPELNRTGTHIAAVITAGEEKHQLLVYDIAKEKVETVGAAGTRDVYSVDWLDEKRLIFRLATQKMWSLGLMAADVGKLRSAYPIQQYTGASIVAIPLKTPLYPLVWNQAGIGNNKDEGVVSLNTSIQSGVLVDLSAAAASSQEYAMARENNQKHILRSYSQPGGKGLTAGYLADKEGNLAYAYRSDEGNLTFLRLEKDSWIPCPVDLEVIDIIGNANDPGQLLVRGPSQNGQPSPLQFMEPATGKLGEVIIQDPVYDFNGWLYRDINTGNVLGAAFNRNGPRMVWFNDEYRALQKILDGMFPGQVVRIRGNDTKHRIFMVETFSDRNPSSYHWVNLETRKAGIFKHSTPWIDAQRMQPMQILSFKTRDNQKLDAYLTLPAGASKEKPAPLVVLCHGGPWARDSWGFNGEVQFLAHHGYAVLQPNYRGSTGSVGRFHPDDEYDFIKMHQDVTDSVKSVLGSGLVDPKRVGIMGGSFGGYLAVSGVAHEPELYRCAVTNAGVFDWALQVQSEKYDQYRRPFYGRLIKKLGDPKKDTAKYEAMSPIKHVANIRVPVFVAGGKDDIVVEIQQSKKLMSAFDDHKITYEKYLVGGEGHGMAFLKHEIEYHDRVLAFFDKNLKSAK